MQQLLRADHSRGVHPRCLCRTPGVDMLVRKLATRYVLARLPNSQLRHHPTCHSHEVAEQQTGATG